MRRIALILMVWPFLAVAQDDTEVITDQGSGLVVKMPEGWDREARSRGCRLIQYYDIDSWQAVALLAKRLPDNPFQAIPVRCQAAVLFTYCEPKSRFVAVISSVQHGKQFVAASSGVPEYPAK